MMIIGDHWGAEDELAEAPFQGAAGWLLKRALSAAGVTMEDCYLTNVFNAREPAHHTDEVARLWHEIKTVQPNVIFALGSTALATLTGEVSIKKHRGFITKTVDGTKVIPSWHPTSVLRNYSLYPILMLDAVKAARHDAFPHLPAQKGKLCVPETILELYNWYREHIIPAKYVVCDIETENDTITEVGFAVSPERAICIPFFKRPSSNYWQHEKDERAAWEIIRIICETKPLVGQNFAYDMKWLWQKMGIPCLNFVHDTMLLHHSIQPELEKGLGFLASAYTDRPAWKFMRKESKTAKKGD